MAEQDCRLLFGWANDAAARAMSFSGDAIPWEAHQEWFARRLEDPNCVAYVVLESTEPVGQVRFDRDDTGTVTISVSVDAKQRGRGIGALAIELGCRAVRQVWPRDPIVAYILPENRASLAAFDHAGFGPVEQCEYRGRAALRTLLAVGG